MEWVSNLHGSTIGLDTAPVIYFIEEHPQYLSIVQSFFSAIDNGEIVAVTSVITLLEVLIHPIRKGNITLAQQYREILLNSNNLDSIPLSPDIAEQSAILRSQYNLHTPDAIQIAIAISAGATHFLTNDSDLPIVSGLTFLILDNLSEQL